MSESQLKLFTFLTARDCCSYICTSSAAPATVKSFSQLLWSAHYMDMWRQCRHLAGSQRHQLTEVQE